MVHEARRARAEVRQGVHDGGRVMGRQRDQDGAVPRAQGHRPGRLRQAGQNWRSHSIL